MRTLTRSQAGLAITGCLALTLATPGLAQAGTGSGRHVVGHAPSWTAHARQTGRLASSAQQHLTFVLTLHDEAGAEALADAVSTPGSAQYGKYVTAAQWRARSPRPPPRSPR